MYVNGRATTSRALRSGDEVRVVGSFFRFLSGDDTEEKYREAISHLAILDIPSGARNHRFLREALWRDKARVVRDCQPLSLAVVSVQPGPDNEELGCDLLRTIANGLEETSRRDWIIARTADLELAVVAHETATELEASLAAKVPTYLPNDVLARLGVVQHEEGLEPEQFIPKARANATVLPG